MLSSSVGSDTGSDCVGTSNRHKAKSVTQIELMSRPARERGEADPWPLWPMIMRTSSSHEEGCNRDWAVLTKEFVGDEEGNMTGIKVVKIEWKVNDEGRAYFEEIEGTEEVLPCELALLAIGFIHTDPTGVIEQLKLDLDQRGNIMADEGKYQTSVPKVFAAGDARRGQSLVVWAISEGREAAREVDRFLMRHTELESKDDSFLNVASAM
jgi:glutamate synthase (NADPH) small chain